VIRALAAALVALLAAFWTVAHVVETARSVML